jgi:hypothetical protein
VSDEEKQAIRQYVAWFEEATAHYVAQGVPWSAITDTTVSDYIIEQYGEARFCETMVAAHVPENADPEAMRQFRLALVQIRNEKSQA